LPILENPRNGNTENEKYFDSELYKRRFKIEKANAWPDSFKALLVRFETLNITRMSLHYLAFSILFLRKIKVQTGLKYEAVSQLVKTAFFMKFSSIPILERFSFKRFSTHII